MKRLKNGLFITNKKTIYNSSMTQEILITDF